MRWCARCRRRLYDESAAFCPFDGTRLEVPSGDVGGSDPHLGTTLQGQFHLLAAIGSGAMGTVYRAWQAGMERTVAVKLLRADLLADLELRRRFLREGRAAARLNHPNIVSVHVVGETDAGEPYLVMEELGGETLDEVMDGGPRLPPARAIGIARQIASALAEAHAAGIVHRDLKPDNVFLVQRRGAGELVKIFDFGIAKIADGARADASRLTRDGDIFGTPHYIAPEQAQGGPLDGRADLYSLGVLLYRMLSGRLPFEGNAVAVLLAHIGHPPPDLAQVAPGLPPGLAALVMRCLAKNPDHRFAGAEELIEALDLEAAACALPRSPAYRRPSTAGEARLPASPIAGLVGRAAARSSESAGAAAVMRPDEELASARTSRFRRRGARAALTAVAIVCAGAGTGAAALFRREGLDQVAAADELGGRAHRSAPARVDAPRTRPLYAAAPPVRRTVVVSEGGHTVRALLPEPIVAGGSADLLFDVWDATGEPLLAPSIPVEVATLATGGPDEHDGPGPDTALAARPVSDPPGRYRLVARFPAPGEAALLLELGGESSIHIHVEIAAAAPDARPRPSRH